MSTGTFLTILTMSIEGILAVIFVLFPGNKKIAIGIFVLAAIVIAIATVSYFKGDNRKPPNDETSTIKETEAPKPKKETEKYEPKTVDLFTLETYSCSPHSLEIDDIYSKSNTGEEYGRSMYYRYSGADTDSSVTSQTYFLNGQYETFKGTVFLPFESRSATSPEYPSVFCVYVDNVLKYEAPDFLSGQNPVDFSVDVSECQYLEIKMGGSWYDHGEKIISIDIRPIVCLANAELIKK